MAVLDASVLSAIFIPTDTHHTRGLNWYSDALLRGEPLLAPTLVLTEVASAVTRATRDVALVARAIAQIEADFELLPLTTQRGRDAANVAATCSVRGADSVYLALAREMDTTLVSLDEEQVTRGAQVVTTERP